MSAGSTHLHLDRGQNATIALSHIKKLDPVRARMLPRPPTPLFAPRSHVLHSRPRPSFLQDVDRVIAYANYIAVYHQADGWQKSGIEGPAYLVQRSVPPHQRLWVTSRLSQRVLMCDVTAELRCEALSGRYMAFEVPGGSGPRALWYPEEDAEGGAALYAAFAQCAAACRGAAGGKAAGQQLLALIRGGGGGGGAKGGSGAGGSSGGNGGGGGSGLPPSVANLFGVGPRDADAPSGAGGSAAPVVKALAPGGGAAAALPSSVASLFGLPSGGAGSAPSSVASFFGPSGGAGGTRSGSARAAGGGGGGASGSGGGDVILTKEALRAALLELLDEEAFVSVIHARYMQNVARERASRKL
jgi:hypothetical protein